MPKKLLFMTWPEHGQANVHLSVIAELQQTHPDAEIHLSSAPELEKRCPPGVKFHKVEYESLSYHFVHGPNGLLKNPKLRFQLEFPTTFFGVIHGILNQAYIILSSTPSEYIKQIKDDEAVIRKVKPDLVIVDGFDNASREAAAKSGFKHVLLSPNTLKESALAEQELGAFAIPFVGSGLPYPIPWYYRPLNILYMLFAGLYINFFDPRIRALNKARHQAGYPGPIPLFGGPRPAPMLCMSVPQLEYPMKIPNDIICCGPILQSPKRLSESDPELYSWVMKRPTILVLLGSHIRLDQHGANEFWKAAKRLLDARPDVQLLWKIQPLGKVDLPGAKAYDDRVKIVSWFNPNPIDILETGNIITMINHGGSNSYHEALSTGTPQVIISPWYDCHDFGIKAEWLGIGRWANKYSAPNIDAKEFGKALMTVVGERPDSPEAVKILARAQECQSLVQQHNGIKPGEDGPTGREIAASKVWDMATTP